ncbi:TetR/AcrR family transcriptional regulator [Microlunatus soli]|uniref:DNA-binding transcriptional regulator, AcrR family n=1 Tax=Microlunatus soli TaxID=630515 RepID=A0A1H1RG42_9ACTN|nr:TetR/AcrR family transcriptional regulator [Microlunatus soli]SDS34662.1 DNA-binding transcriptional regulator, AcrR family [Microlunatus soli]
MRTTPEPAVRSGVRAAILNTAAAVIAERGDAASMAEIAATAGVGRATLYRYFPSREQLLQGMTVAAMEELAGNIAAAELETVDVPEALARLSRAFLAAATRYAALVHLRDRHLTKPAELEERIARPVLDVLRRGIADGSLRSDVPLELQFTVLTGLYEKVMRLVLSGELQAERASSLVTSVFLDGAGVSSVGREFGPTAGNR